MKTLAPIRKELPTLSIHPSVRSSASAKPLRGGNFAIELRRALAALSLISGALRAAREQREARYTAQWLSQTLQLCSEAFPPPGPTEGVPRFRARARLPPSTRARIPCMV